MKSFYEVIIKSKKYPHVIHNYYYVTANNIGIAAQRGLVEFKGDNKADKNLTNSAYVDSVQYMGKIR